jgi:hypothetical protein
MTFFGLFCDPSERPHESWRPEAFDGITVPNSYPPPIPLIGNHLQARCFRIYRYGSEHKSWSREYVHAHNTRGGHQWIACHAQRIAWHMQAMAYGRQRPERPTRCLRPWQRAQSG